MLRLRYSLRNLLLVTLLLGCGLGWWFRPYTIEKSWPNGAIKSRLHVQRSWNGAVVTKGQQSWWWSNGQLARTGESYGHRATGRNVALMPLDDEVMYDTQGEQVAPVGADFGLLWLQFHSDQNLSVFQSAADQFPETPHSADGASTSGNVLLNVP